MSGDQNHGMPWLNQCPLVFNGESEIFFQPIQLYLELADLLIKLQQKFFPIPILFLPTVREEMRKLFEKLLSPLANLVGMDSKLTGQLGKGLFSSQSLQGNLSLESRIMSSPHVAHRAVPPFGSWQANMHLIPLSSFWGVL